MFVSRSISMCVHDSNWSLPSTSASTSAEVSSGAAAMPCSSPGAVRTTRQNRMHHEVDAEVVAVEHHCQRVDQERHVVEHDVDRRVAVSRRVDAYEHFARCAVAAEAPVLERGASEVVSRPGREVVVAELLVVGAHEDIGAGRIGRVDEIADLRHHLVAAGHEADHTVHSVLIGTIRVLPYARRVNTVESLQLALELADLADGITMSRFRAHDLVVTTKPDLTPVSEADQAVERELRARLAHTRHVVLGEEYGTETGADGGDAGDSDDSKYRWIIDPIDGTKSYVRGVPIWATLIGLERAGEMIVGVASAPALGMRWWAGKGLGAFRDGERLGVSSVAALDDAQVSFAWDTSERFHAGGIGTKLVDLSHKCWRTRGIGDFWQHLLVAEGAFDIAIDPIVSLWDIAALIPIIKEAGGRWSTVDGRADANGESFVCTNGLLHDAVVASLA